MKGDKTSKEIFSYQFTPPPQELWHCTASIFIKLLMFHYFMFEYLNISYLYSILNNLFQYLTLPGKQNTNKMISLTH